MNNKNLTVDVDHVDQPVVIAPPELELVKRGGKVRASEIVQYPFISREEGSGTRDVIMQYLMDEDVNPDNMNFSLEPASPEATKGAIEVGMRMTNISRLIIDKEVRLKKVCELQLDPPRSRLFSFVRRRRIFRVTVMEILLEFAQPYFKRNAWSIV